MEAVDNMLATTKIPDHQKEYAIVLISKGNKDE